MKSIYDDVFNRITAEIEMHRGGKRLVLFGADLTGKLVYDAVKNHPVLTVDFFLDSKPWRKRQFPPLREGLKVLSPEEAELDEDTQTVVLCAHPRWYFEMMLVIRKRYKQVKIIELLRDGSLREKVEAVNRRINRKDERYRKIRLVIESQPRSGSTWLVKTLARVFKGNFASTFKMDYIPLRHRYYQDVYYGDFPGELFVLSHFFQPVNHHVAKRYPIIYPIRYIFDAFYSWGDLQHRYKKNMPGPYFLSAQSAEWDSMKEHIPLNKYWLDLIKNSVYLRYEDWSLDKNANVDKIRQFIPEAGPGLFEVKVNKDRLYYSGDYRSRMDEEIFWYLKENFKEHIDHYWPEKSGDTY